MLLKLCILVWYLLLHGVGIHELVYWELSIGGELNTQRLVENEITGVNAIAIVYIVGYVFLTNTPVSGL